MTILEQSRTMKLFYSPERIVALREHKGWNQSELARRSKISSPSLWTIERGETVQPKAETLFNIATAPGVPLSEIMAHDQPSDTLEQIRAGAAALSPENQGAVLAAIRAFLDAQNKPPKF